MMPKFIQIECGAWDGHSGRTYTLFGLDEAGEVWRYKPQYNDWELVGKETETPPRILRSKRGKRR
jgi:hypothetical protein